MCFTAVKICIDAKMYFNYIILYLVISLFLWENINGSSHSCGRMLCDSYLDVASDMIAKAKRSLPTCSGAGKIYNSTEAPGDCADVLNLGRTHSGVYTIWLMNRVTGNKPLDVYCDMDTDGGGWTVIQRRGNFQRADDYFYKDWKSYKEGFGNKKMDFWLGNDYIFALTNLKQYSVRFDLKDMESKKRHARYDTFWIDDEFHNYTLHIDDYIGDAGDSMIIHNLRNFTTKDRDNDKYSSNCANTYRGGWWYNSCLDSNLNGPYLRERQTSNGVGVNWKTWKGLNESLDSTEIKIRPSDFAGIAVPKSIPQR